MKLVEKFHGIRTYVTLNEDFLIDVDNFGNIKRIYKRTGIESYCEINLADAPAALRNARFERDL